MMNHDLAYPQLLYIQDAFNHPSKWEKVIRHIDGEAVIFSIKKLKQTTEDNTLIGELLKRKYIKIKTFTNNHFFFPLTFKGLFVGYVFK